MTESRDLMGKKNEETMTPIMVRDDLALMLHELESVNELFSYYKSMIDTEPTVDDETGVTTLKKLQS
ncbi:MAG TPA: hypothetical protein ENI45_00235 [Thermoplasmatales archaeon]|nr:hypothetical protein [Thermoplasmatales archaeon]